MSEIQKNNINEILVQSSCDDYMKIGAIFIYNTYFCKITKIYVNEYDILEVSYDDTTNFGVSWSQYGSNNIEQFIDKFPKSSFLTSSIEDFMNEVNDVISGKKSLAEYKDSENISDSTSLMNVRSKEYLKTLQDSMELKKNSLEMISKGVKIEMEKRKKELEQFKSSLDVIVSEFRDKIKRIEEVIYTIELYLGIKEDIVQIQKGKSADVSESIHFWQERLFMDEEVGDPDDDGLDFSNISDFDSWLLKYSTFYKKHNYELLIPQQKGLIVLRVRRNDKKYERNNPFLNSILNQENYKTYILIRNGTDVYRIWGDIIINKLFPDKERLAEMKTMWEWLEKEELRKDNDNNIYIGKQDLNDVPLEYKSKYGWSSFDTYDEKKKLDDEAFIYKQQFLMLQGLLDRTEVFYPIPERIQLMDTTAIDKGYVNFVYEDKGNKIDDGKLTFSGWLKSLNKEITYGSRVLYVSQLDRDYNYGKIDHRRLDKRFHGDNEYNLPKSPSTNIYSIEKYVTEDIEYKEITIESLETCPEYFKEYISETIKYNRFPVTTNYRDENGRFSSYTVKKEFKAIFYNPEDEVRNWWNVYDDGHKRKNRLSYKIYDDDKFILNYDLISLDDIEYYLYDRKNRKDYLQRMPLLNELKNRRLDELKKENEFIRGLIDEMKRKNVKISDPKQQIYSTIEWWKLKNKVKRPITENDSLAWKQIKNKLGI